MASFRSLASVEQGPDQYRFGQIVAGIPTYARRRTESDPASFTPNRYNCPTGARRAAWRSLRAHGCPISSLTDGTAVEPGTQGWGDAVPSLCRGRSTRRRPRWSRERPVRLAGAPVATAVVRLGLRLECGLGIGLVREVRPVAGLPEAIFRGAEGRDTSGLGGPTTSDWAQVRTGTPWLAEAIAGEANAWMSARASAGSVQSHLSNRLETRSEEGADLTATCDDATFFLIGLTYPSVAVLQ